MNKFNLGDHVAYCSQYIPSNTLIWIYGTVIVEHKTGQVDIRMSDGVVRTYPTSVLTKVVTVRRYHSMEDEPTGPSNPAG